MWLGIFEIVRNDHILFLFTQLSVNLYMNISKIVLINYPYLPCNNTI